MAAAVAIVVAVGSMAVLRGGGSSGGEVAVVSTSKTAPAVLAAALAEAGVGLGDVDAVAVTRGPGLIGALLVGISSAKALAAPRRLAMVAVDWEYLDSSGNAVPGESYRYLIRVDACGPRITTVIATS